MKFLQGRKTYIVMAVGIIAHGLVAMGIIDASLIGTINAVLGFLGLGALRAGIK